MMVTTTATVIIAAMVVVTMEPSYRSLAVAWLMALPLCDVKHEAAIWRQ
jgi:hypothetical protein